MRKHVSQMRQNEKAAIQSAVNAITDWAITDYASSRACSRIVTDDELMETIKSGKIIEYKRSKKDKRVLLRGTKLIQEKYVACVVVSLTCKCIVTAYVNKEQDDHTTLNWALYTQSADLMKEMEEFK